MKGIGLLAVTTDLMSYNSSCY